jgi:hypothetical protein
MRENRLHVCFVADFNKTMENKLGSLTNNFEGLFNDVLNQYPKNTIEVAFIGYGAISDIPSTIYEPFTKDIQFLQRKMRNAPLSRGFADQCRNVVNGYVMANGLKWHYPLKIMFHMGNAPSYGKQYHERNILDDYSYGHPYWTLEDQIQQLAIKEIDVVILKISKTTTVMEKLLSSQYSKIRNKGFFVVDLTGKLNTLDDAVYETVKHHIVRLLTQ